MIKVFLKRIEDLSPENEQEIISSLSPDARERLNKKRNESLKLSSLCALSMLDKEERKALSYSEDGSPYLVGIDACISVSHSEKYAAVAISDSKCACVGVDVEDADKAVNESTRFLCENEKKDLKDGIPYLEIWTKKEALFKYLKNDSTPFIHLDSAEPEKYGAKVTTKQIDGSFLSVASDKDEKIQIIKK